MSKEPIEQLEVASREAAAKVQEFKAEYAELNRRVNDLLTGAGPKPNPPLKAQAVALLEGRPVERQDLEGLRTARDQTLDELRHKRNLIHAAIPLAEQRRGEARAAWSRAVCEAAKPEYAEKLKRLAAAVRVVAGTMLEIKRFRDELRDRDVAVDTWLPDGLPPSRLHFEDYDLEHGSDRLVKWFEELRREWGIK